MCLRSLTADIHVPTEIISKQTFLKLSKNNNNRLYASGVETEQEKLQPWSIYFARKLQTTESRSSVGGQLHPLLSWLAGAQQATRSPGTRCLQRCREGASVVGSTNTPFGCPVTNSKVSCAGEHVVWQVAQGLSKMHFSVTRMRSDKGFVPLV